MEIMIPFIELNAKVSFVVYFVQFPNKLFSVFFVGVQEAKGMPKSCKQQQNSSQYGHVKNIKVARTKEHFLLMFQFGWQIYNGIIKDYAISNIITKILLNIITGIFESAVSGTQKKDELNPASLRNQFRIPIRLISESEPRR